MSLQDQYFVSRLENAFSDLEVLNERARAQLTFETVAMFVDSVLPDQANSGDIQVLFNHLSKMATDDEHIQNGLLLNTSPFSRSLSAELGRFVASTAAAPAIDWFFAFAPRRQTPGRLALANATFYKRGPRFANVDALLYMRRIEDILKKMRDEIGLFFKTPAHRHLWISFPRYDMHFEKATQAFPKATPEVVESVAGATCCLFLARYLYLGLPHVQRDMLSFDYPKEHDIERSTLSAYPMHYFARGVVEVLLVEHSFLKGVLSGQDQVPVQDEEEEENGKEFLVFGPLPAMESDEQAQLRFWTCLPIAIVDHIVGGFFLVDAMRTTTPVASNVHTYGGTARIAIHQNALPYPGFIYKKKMTPSQFKLYRAQYFLLRALLRDANRYYNEDNQSDIGLFTRFLVPILKEKFPADDAAR